MEKERAIPAILVILPIFVILATKTEYSNRIDISIVVVSPLASTLTNGYLQP